MEIEQYLRAFVAGWMASGSDNPISEELLKSEAMTFAGDSTKYAHKPFKQVLEITNIAAEKLYRELSED